MQLSLHKQEHEVVVVLYLDAQNGLIAVEELRRFSGVCSRRHLSIPGRSSRQRINAASVILAYNHPSGLAEPSSADEHQTQALDSALALVDVRALDHLIVAGSAAVSFAERGLK